MSISSTHWKHSDRTWGHIMALLMWCRSHLEFQNTRCPVESFHLLADLAGDIWLQPACEDLVYDAVAVVGVIGLLPIIITWGKTEALWFIFLPPSPQSQQVSKCRRPHRTRPLTHRGMMKPEGSINSKGHIKIPIIQKTDLVGKVETAHPVCFIFNFLLHS